MALLARILTVSVVVVLVSASAKAQLAINVNPNPPTAGSSCMIGVTGGPDVDSVITIWYQEKAYLVKKTPVGTDFEFQIPSTWTGGFRITADCNGSTASVDVSL